MGHPIMTSRIFNKIFDTASPHRHAFYYEGLSTVVTKSLIPSLPAPTLRPLRHLWTTPMVTIKKNTLNCKYRATKLMKLDLVYLKVKHH